MSDAPVEHEGPDPVVWLLTGHKAGDNSQVLALAEALGWPYRTLRFYYRPWELVTNRLLGATLAGIDRKRSSPLAPPWPDLVITAGRRNEPVARWIQRQSPQTKLVHIGRPWSPLSTFDLIITTPQYFLPDLPNILHNSLPLHGVNSQALEEAAEHWLPHLEGLPRPWISVLIGGDSGQFVFTPEKGRRLGRQVNTLAQSRGGSLLVSSSARTPLAMLDAFRAELSMPVYLHEWQSGQSENPYLAYLQLADEFVVTGESMSMLTEAAHTGKPLHIFDPGDTSPWWKHAHAYRFKPLSHHLAMRFGPARMRRDIGNIQRELLRVGRTGWLGSGSSAVQADSAERDDLNTAVNRVRVLFRQ
ncbi:MAG: mitochondrial fission ELM1 family protein [bacterium]